MNRYPKTILLLLLFGFSNIAIGQKAIKNYIKKYESIALEKAKAHGIPASVILGVSIVESAAGQSAICKALKNFFGIKGKNWSSEKKMGFKSAYKEYKTEAESFEHFCQVVIKKKFYTKLKGDMDYKKWLKEMNESSYASAKQKWVDDITKTIKKHDLDDLDKPKEDQAKAETKRAQQAAFVLCAR